VFRFFLLKRSPIFLAFLDKFGLVLLPHFLNFRAVIQIKFAVNGFPRFRVAVRLVVVHEFDYKKIADILQIPIGTVMSRLNRARIQLRKSLAKVAGEYGIKTSRKSELAFVENFSFLLIVLRNLKALRFARNLKAIFLQSSIIKNQISRFARIIFDKMNSLRGKINRFVGIDGFFRRQIFLRPL